MFAALTTRMESTLTALNGRSLGEVATDELLRDIKIALLEADVSLRVTKGFITTLTNRLAHADRGVDAREFIAANVLDCLTDLLGPAYQLPAQRPLLVAVCGLQGAGKTTLSAKLAHRMADANPLLVAADLFRPAAVAQLQILAKPLAVLTASDGDTSVSLAARAREVAAVGGHELIIVDTTGRQAADDGLMAELSDILAACRPDVVLLVLDGATGQTSLEVAARFVEHADIDAVVLTKMDGDSRGGLALSLSGTLALPVAFLSTGERTRDLTEFHPDRLARRILGEGDLLSLAEQAEAEMGPQRTSAGGFTLEDFAYYVAKIRSMGPVAQLLAMVPGVPASLRESALDDRHIAHIQAAISSMTSRERANPTLIDEQRAARIAAGAGVDERIVAGLLEQFSSIGDYFERFGRRR